LWGAADQSGIAVLVVEYLNRWAHTLMSFFTHRYLLNTSWWWSLGLSSAGYFVTVYGVAVMVDLNVSRSQYLYTFMPLLGAIPYGISYVVSVYAAVECAQEGSEGIMYGFLSTVQNIAQPLGSLLASQVCLCPGQWMF
jgi:hypothetical protein